jgi:hypothetical protein
MTCKGVPLATSLLVLVPETSGFTPARLRLVIIRIDVKHLDVDHPRLRPFDHLSEELHKLLAGVPGGGLANTLPDCVSSAAYSDNVP